MSALLFAPPTVPASTGSYAGAPGCRRFRYCCLRAHIRRAQHHRVMRAVQLLTVRGMRTHTCIAGAQRVAIAVNYN
jgi:hypothetical protein